MACTSCAAVPRGPGSDLGGTSDGGPAYGPGSYGSDNGVTLSEYFRSLKARICPKCATFWMVLAIIVVLVYVNRKG